jgi:hypothetical protein
MDKQAGPGQRSRLKEARSRLLQWKFLHINTHKRASPVATMKVQRYRRKLFLWLAPGPFLRIFPWGGGIF